MFIIVPGGGQFYYNISKILSPVLYGEKKKTRNYYQKKKTIRSDTRIPSCDFLPFCTLNFCFYIWKSVSLPTTNWNSLFMGKFKRWVCISIPNFYISIARYILSYKNCFILHHHYHQNLTWCRFKVQVSCETSCFTYKFQKVFLKYTKECDFQSCGNKLSFVCKILYVY